MYSVVHVQYNYFYVKIISSSFPAGHGFTDYKIKICQFNFVNVLNKGLTLHGNGNAVSL